MHGLFAIVLRPSNVGYIRKSTDLWQSALMATFIVLPHWETRPSVPWPDKWYPTQSHYPDTGPTSPFPILITMSTWQGSDKYQFDKLMIWLDHGIWTLHLPHTPSYVGHYIYIYIYIYIWDNLIQVRKLVQWQVDVEGGWIYWTEGSSYSYRQMVMRGALVVNICRWLQLHGGQWQITADVSK